MKDGKFHRSLGFPPGACQPWLGVFSLQHTGHSLEQCRRSATGSANSNRIDIPEGDVLEIDSRAIVEIEVENGKPVKALVRLVYSDTHDVVMALCAPEGDRVRCKTLWLNHCKDQHKTLTTKYQRP